MPPSSPQGFQYSPILATAQMIDTRTGIITGTVWPLAFQQLSNQILTIQAVANNAFGTNFFTVATQPTLGASDAGYVGFLTDYGHLVYWSGAAWVFLDGGGGFFQDFVTTPQGAGWQIADGTATHYLTVGATLTETAFTTPDLTTGAYRKGGAYTGAVVAASAPSLSGATDTGTTGSGATDTGTTGSGTTGNSDSVIHFPVGVGANFDLAPVPHAHSVPGLSIPSLNVPGLSVPALGVGTLAADATGEPAHLAVRIYFRR